MNDDVRDSLIPYDEIVQDALRAVVGRVLSQVEGSDSLPGEHHFYITFKTPAPGVDIPAHLVAKFPDEMTIVLQNRFWDLSVELITYLHDETQDPECDDMLLFIQNIVMNDQKKQIEGAECWCENMLEPLDKKVKYSKALERILNVDEEPVKGGVVMHALAYRDIDAMSISSTSNVFRRMGLQEKMKAGNWTEEKSAVVWAYMDDLANVAFRATGMTRPRVPTRAELAKNIKSKKPSTSNISMSRAFGIAVNALCESRGCKGMHDDATVADIKKRCCAVSGEMIGDRSIADMVTSHDESSLTSIHTAVPELGVGTEKPLTTSEWGILTQIFSMVRVERAVPSGMMNTIEHFASKLTNDLMEGKMDLSPDRLEALGSEVMGHINQNDLQSMSENLADLLPALGAMGSSAMSGMAGAGAQNGSNPMEQMVNLAASMANSGIGGDGMGGGKP